ncbi:MAG: hypothetical protein Q9195_008254 [Heterodermia aff. obscurata]
MSTYGSGNVLSTYSGPNIYTVTQAPAGSTLPPSSHLAALGVDIKSQRAIGFSFGPVTLSGYVDTTNYGLGVEIGLFGISLGNFYGNVKEGLVISIDIRAAKGEVRLYLKGNGVWVKIQLTPIWGGEINADEKLFAL